MCFHICSMLTIIGPDASPIVVPLAKFGFENQRALPFLSQEPILQSAPSRRLMASWWDREVQIWRLDKQSTAVMSEEVEDTEKSGRKLVAKILLKGEANITSAVLSTDGSLLAVATNTDIKMFSLRPKPMEDREGLRISKVVLPTSIATGARLLRFSPDGKWLSIIRPDSQIILARISSASSTSITVYPQIFKPSRLDRRTSRHILLGGLGTYDRTITQIAFSSDGTLLAVSDLAGYIDTFVLVGVEDLTQSMPEEDASSENSDLESDSDEEEETKPRLVFGQHWTRNPAASLLPKLPSAPVVLSFRPSNEIPTTVTNGVAPHPTRNTPNPVSHDLPDGEDRLLVVTATSDVFEFEVLKGGLTPWSRKNPTSSFPRDFRKTLDQIRGCIWDVKDSRERIWLYSINSLWMFDLSQDFPADTSLAQGQKRKRGAKEHPSGAGGHVQEDKLNTGISRKMQKRSGEEADGQGHEEEIIIHSSPSPSDMDIDPNSDIEDISTLEPLPQNSSEIDIKPNNDHPQKWFWKTFKYRPILGIVEIGEGDEFGPEVALVERPGFETLLPDRYHGDQEWREKEIALLG